MAGQKRTDNKGRKLPDGFSQRSDGRYQARWTFEGKRYCMYDQDLAVLKKKVMQYKVDLENGNLRIIEKVTLNQWFDKWMLAYKKDKIKPLTYANYEKYWNRYIRDTIGKMEMSKIKRIHVIELYNSLLNKDVKPLSIGTITYVNNLVYSSLEQAVRNDVLMSKKSAYYNLYKSQFSLQ